MLNLINRAKQSWPPLTVLFGALTILAPTAHASMSVCNKTAADIQFSYAIAAPECNDPLAWNKYKLNGWWYVRPTECIQVSSRDLKNVGFSFTALQGSTHWGARFVEPFMVPTASHNNICLRDVYYVCNNGGSCRNLYHFFISSGTTNKTIDILPNNGYVTR